MVCKLCLKAVKNTGMHTKPTAEALGSCGSSIGSVLRGFYFPHSGVEKITSAHQHQENAEICSSISSWIIEECGGDRGMLPTVPVWLTIPGPEAMRTGGHGLRLQTP